MQPSFQQLPQVLRRSDGPGRRRGLQGLRLVAGRCDGGVGIRRRVAARVADGLRGWALRRRPRRAPAGVGNNIARAVKPNNVEDQIADVTAFVVLTALDISEPTNQIDRQ